MPQRPIDLIARYGTGNPQVLVPISVEYRVTTDRDGGTLFTPSNYWGGPDGEPYYWQDRLGRLMHSNFRFTNVQIPRNAPIVSAAVSLWSRDTFAANSSKWNDIGAEQVDNATQPTNAANFGSRATNVGTVVRWTYGASVVNQPMISPDLAEVVQEIVNRPGWNPGQAIQFFTETDTNVGGGWGADPQGQSVSYTGGVTSRRPRLEVTYLG